MGPETAGKKVRSHPDRSRVLLDLSSTYGPGNCLSVSVTDNYNTYRVGQDSFGPPPHGSARPGLREKKKLLMTHSDKHLTLIHSEINEWIRFRQHEWNPRD